MQAQGVLAAEIDASYSLNGGLLYAHPENLPPSVTTADIPWVTAKGNLPYTSSNTPLPEYEVLKTIS